MLPQVVCLEDDAAGEEVARGRSLVGLFDGAEGAEAGSLKW